ncbi:MAG: nucleotide-binding protein [Candidatus Hodarchaeales archaeon]|jgi:MinD-like ATPase involved in chromosome partitioning or flagellar assembly
MEIIATHSFRGGSGKSFIALNMAAVSARAGLKTIVMDCDFGSPSFQSNLSVQIPPNKFGNDFLLNTSRSDKIITPTDLCTSSSVARTRITRNDRKTTFKSVTTIFTITRDVGEERIQKIVS